MLANSYQDSVNTMEFSRLQCKKSPYPLSIHTSFTIDTSHAKCPMCSFRSMMRCTALRDTHFISFNLKRP